jgi:ABC-type antimicrobial peptide transport system permease subunit
MKPGRKSSTARCVCAPDSPISDLLRNEPIAPGADAGDADLEDVTGLEIRRGALALRVQLPQEPRRVRDDVQTDLNVMFLLLGGLSLVVGALGIANITLVGVMERTAEIGLRRAIGATRRHIAAQFLIESASMGIMGGLLGSSIGVLIVVGVCLRFSAILFAGW